MKPKFWLERWQQNQLGFHQPEHNPLLVEYWPCLDLAAGSTVFVPLCGKSLDMRWLRDAGHRVLGVELARLAVESFFDEAGESPECDTVDRFARYRANDVEILEGDFFDLTAPLLGDVRGVFDRGALVALPPDMRFRYVDHTLRILPEGCRILLLALEYDQRLVPGPPHSVLPEEVERLYGHRCEIELLETIVTRSLPPHFQEAGLTQAAESVWLLTKSQ